MKINTDKKVLRYFFVLTTIIFSHFSYIDGMTGH
jgi:hypothetical protein